MTEYGYIAVLKDYCPHVSVTRTETMDEMIEYIRGREFGDGWNVWVCECRYGAAYEGPKIVENGVWKGLEND